MLNKSHAAAYAVVSYETAYLMHYPVEFMAALMSSVMGESEPRHIVRCYQELQRAESKCAALSKSQGIAEEVYSQMARSDLDY